MAESEIQHPPNGTATTTDVASSVVSVLVLAANVNRGGGSILNQSQSRLYLSASGTATVGTGLLKVLERGEKYPIESGYTGIISGIWAPIASGFARVTEFTP